MSLSPFIIFRLIRTLFDIGYVRLQRRLRYEIRQRLDRFSPITLSQP